MQRLQAIVAGELLASDAIGACVCRVGVDEVFVACGAGDLLGCCVKIAEGEVCIQFFLLKDLSDNG